MPAAAPKACTQCGVAVRDGTARCAQHKAAPSGIASKTRASRHERGYGTAWEKLRLVVLARDAGLCQVCLVDGHVTVANIVDHITPKSEGGTDGMDNLRCICKEHHMVKTQQEAARARARGAIDPRYWISTRGRSKV